MIRSSRVTNRSTLAVTRLLCAVKSAVVCGDRTEQAVVVSG
jgi:hypothetical protein